MRDGIFSLAGCAVLVAAVFLTGAASSARADYLFEADAAPALPATVAYAADGTLYAFEASAGGVPTGSNVLGVRDASGVWSTLTLDREIIASTGAWFDGLNNRLLIADNYVDNGNGADSGGRLYSVNVLTGATSIVLDGMDAIDDVAVRSTGEIFVSDAAGGGAGAVYQVDEAAGTATAVATGLDYAAGLAFDPSGDLIYQQSTASFVGEIYRLAITEDPAKLTFGASSLIASGVPSADLAVDSEGDIFATGSGGVFMLDAANAYAASLFYSNDNPWQFAGEIAFLTGSGPFESTAGPNGSALTFVPDWAAGELVTATVPEPASVVLLMGGVLAAASRRRA